MPWLRLFKKWAKAETFRGYGPEQGYDFPSVKQSSKGDYKPYGIEISMDEVFVSDGAKLTLVISKNYSAKIISSLSPTPVYPVYADSNVIGGRTGTKPLMSMFEKVVCLPTFAKTKNFSQEFPCWTCRHRIYLLPNNPTGTVLSRT